MDLFNVFNLLEGGTDTSMDTENLVVCTFIVDDGSERQVLKHIVELLENRVGVVDVFTEAARALLSQAQESIDVPILVVTSEQENLFRVLELQCH